MSLNLKLAIASAASLALVAVLCLLFLWNRGPLERRDAEPPGTTPDATLAHGRVVAKKTGPESSRQISGAVEAKPAVQAAPAEGGWRIAGRIVRDDSSTRTVGPVEGVIVLLKARPRPTSPGEVLARLVTGPDGRFDFAHVPGKRWMRIEIDAPSSAYQALSFQLEEPRGDSTRDVGDILLEPATTLTIQILGPTGEPAAKGRVLVGRNAPMRPVLLANLGIEDGRRRAEERQPGTYVLERAAPGSNYVLATAPGCSEAREEVELPREEPLLMRLTAGYRIAGTVRSAGGASIANAELEVLSGPGASELAPSATTDAAGRFVFDTLALGEYIIGVRAHGFASIRKRNVASGTEDLDIVLEAEAVFGGKVVAAVDGRAVWKAEVALRDLEGQTLVESSDPKGIFRLDGIGAGVYTITARQADFAPANEGPIEIGPAERIEDHVIRLSAGVTAAGKVLESETGDPVVGAEVSFAARPSQGPARTTLTSEDGAFEVKALAEGNFEVRASAPGYLRGKQQTVEVPAAGARDIALPLTRGGSISGRVLDPQGKPVEGAVVQPSINFTTPEVWNEVVEDISNVSSRTDSGGRYRLEGLPAHGSYTVKASSANFAAASRKGIAVGRREEVQGVDLTLTPGGAIQGRVVDDAGPIAGASVQAEQEVEEERAMVYTAADAIGKIARTDPEGNYTLSPLNAGVYTVTCRAKDHASSRREKVNVAEGRTVDGIDLILSTGEVLSGRVVDDDGNGIAAAAVGVHGAVKSQTRTDTEGQFRLGGLRASSVTLNAQKAGFVEGSVEMTVPGPEVTVKLQRLARIGGKVQAKGQDTFPSFQVIALPQGDNRVEPGSFKDPTQNDPTGRFEVEVGPGTYVLQATVKGFAPSLSKAIAVKPGDRHEGVMIDLLAGGKVDGVVVARETGTPIEGAKVRSKGDEVQPWDGFSASMATTGPDGSFKLEGVPEKFTLIATHKKYVQAMIPDLSVRAGESTSIRMEMDSGGGIRGTVSRAGAPTAGIEVRASKQGTGEQFEKQTKTDSAGRFELAMLSAGEYVLTLGAGNGALTRRSVLVVDGEVAEVDIVEGMGLRLFGRVTSGGAPVAGGSISAAQPETGWESGGPIPLGPQGEYSIELPAPGTYMILVQMAGRDALSGTRVNVTLPEGVSEYSHDIDVPTGGLTGVVLDAETGDPISGARVIAYVSRPGPAFSLPLAANLQGWAKADGAGRFNLASLDPGRYSLRATAEGYADAAVEGVRLGPPGDTPEIELSLHRGITFGARIVDERGQPVAQAAAFLRAQAGDVVRANEPPRSREDGRLELAGFLPGTYKMMVLHRDFAPARVTVQAVAGAEPTVILRAGGKLSISVMHRGRPVEGAAIELLDETGENILDVVLFLSFKSGGAQFQTKSDGTMILEQVPAGTYRLRASKEVARSREERILVKQGETAEVRLTLD